MDLPLSLRMAKSVESRYRPGMMLWHYEHGLVLYASLRSAEVHGDASVYPWVYSMYDKLIGQDGSIATYREGEYNLDQINAGKTLFALADKSGEERFSLAADRLHHQLLNHPRCKCGVFWHKEIYPWQIWLDGLYMEGPFSAEYYLRHNDIVGIEDIVEQLKTTYKLLRDPETGLLYHAYDESRGMKWSNDETGCSPHFWSPAALFTHPVTHSRRFLRCHSHPPLSVSSAHNNDSAPALLRFRTPPVSHLFLPPSFSHPFRPAALSTHPPLQSVKGLVPGAETVNAALQRRRRTIAEVPFQR